MTSDIFISDVNVREEMSDEKTEIMQDKLDNRWVPVVDSTYTIRWEGGKVVGRFLTVLKHSLFLDTSETSGSKKNVLHLDCSFTFTVI